MLSEFEAVTVLRELERGEGRVLESTTSFTSISETATRTSMTD